MKTEEQDRINEAATQHLIKEVRWKRDEFQVKFREVIRDGKLAVVWAIHIDDKNLPYGSPQKSLELHVDVSSLKVVQVLHFQ